MTSYKVGYLVGSLARPRSSSVFASRVSRHSGLRQAPLRKRRPGASEFVVMRGDSATCERRLNHQITLEKVQEVAT